MIGRSLGYAQLDLGLRNEGKVGLIQTRSAENLWYSSLS